MRPADGKRDLSMFEQWMGMTPEEWEALGATDDPGDGERVLLL